MICPICKGEVKKINSLKILNLCITFTNYCLNCGVFFRDPLPSRDSIIHYYSSRYFRYPDNIEKEMAKIQGSFLIQNIGEFIKNNHLHYLEFGSGRGWLLSNLQNSAFVQSAIGFEPDSVSTQWGRDNLHVDLRDGMLDEHQLDIISHDFPETNLISMVHVLEHLHNPIEILSIIKKKMNPHFLFLEVPDAEYEGRVMEIDTFPWSSMGQHFWSFSEESLRVLLENNGYQIISLVHDGQPQYWDRQIENISLWNNYFNNQKNRFNTGNFRLSEIILTDFAFLFQNSFLKLKNLMKKRYSRLDLPVIRILAKTI